MKITALETKHKDIQTEIDSLQSEQNRLVELIGTLQRESVYPNKGLKRSGESYTKRQQRKRRKC